MQKTSSIYLPPETELLCCGDELSLCSVSYGDDGLAGAPMTGDEEHVYEY